MMNLTLVISGIVGIGGDLLLCWLSWRFFVKPRLIRLMDQRIDARLKQDKPHLKAVA